MKQKQCDKCEGYKSKRHMAPDSSGNVLVLAELSPDAFLRSAVCTDQWGMHRDEKKNVPFLSPGANAE
jgi:hypothetical protein